MAFPLTSYKTFPAQASPIPATVYTAPAGYTALVLTAQVANQGLSGEDFTLNHVRSAVSNAIISQYTVPSNEVLYVSGGSSGTLVLEPGDSLEIIGTSSDLIFTLSLVEIPA